MVCVEIILRSATHGMLKHNLILLYACSFDGTRHWAEKSKASEKANKWKVIIHNRPEELKTGEMTFGCEILWATERETRKFPSRGSFRVSWAAVKNESQPIRCCESGFEGICEGISEEREKKVFPAFFDKKLLKILLQFSKWVAKLELQENLQGFFFFLEPTDPLNDANFAPKEKTINYDVFTQIFTEDAAESFHLNACYLQ